MARLNPAFEDRAEYHAGFLLYQEWFSAVGATRMLPMPHWGDLPQASRDALAGIALRVVRAYSIAKEEEYRRDMERGTDKILPDSLA